MNLQDLLVNTRMILKDVGVKILPDPLLVTFANEGKNELYRLIRAARQDFFVTTSNVTVSGSNAPAPNTISLPADFSQLKDIICTTLSGVANPTQITFLAWDRNDVIFRYLLASSFTGTTGVGMVFYYDIMGTSLLQMVPPTGTASTMTAQLTYLAAPADMAAPSDSPSTIPTEYHQYIMNFMVTEAMRTTNDPRLAAYETKMVAQAEKVARSVGTRSLNEPQERG